MDCANCQCPIHDDDFYRVERGDYSAGTNLCSLSCLMAIAWKWRESQPKLSKSKQEQSDAIHHT